MKKIMIFGLLSTLVLASCGKKESPTEQVSTEETSSSEVVVAVEALPYETELVSGEYIELPVGTTNPYEKSLLLTIDVTNTSKDTLSLSANDFALKDESGELFENHVYLDDNFEEGFTEVIQKSRTQPRQLIFYTEEIASGTGKYELVARASSLDEWVDTDIVIEVAKYQDTMSELEKSTTALKSYMDLVLYGQESQDFLAYTTNDLELTKNTSEEQWNDSLLGLAGFFTFYKTSDDEKQSMYRTYQAKQLARNEILVEKVFDDLTTAEFKISGKAFSKKKSVAAFKVYVDANAEATKRRGITEGLYEKDVIDKLGEALDKAELQEFSDFTISLKKVDSKWEVENDNRGLTELAKGQIGD